MGFFSCSIFPPSCQGTPAMDYNRTKPQEQTKPKEKKNGHEMSTYGGFWARLEFFYLLGKTKLEKKKVKVMMGMR